MKKVLSMLLVLLMLLSLCACSKDDTANTDPSTTSGQAASDHTEDPTTDITEAPAPCSHSYKDATCTKPKTCSKCGATDGKALGHNYVNGICTGCGLQNVQNIPLEGENWSHMSLAGELYSLEFLGNGEAYFSASMWCNIKEYGFEFEEDFLKTDEEVQAAVKEALGWGYTVISANGEYYLSLGFGQELDVSYEQNGNTVTLTVINRDGSMVLEFVNGNQLKVVSAQGKLENSVQIGGIFDGFSVVRMEG